MKISTEKKDCCILLMSDNWHLHYIKFIFAILCDLHSFAKAFSRVGLLVSKGGFSPPHYDCNFSIFLIQIVVLAQKMRCYYVPTRPLTAHYYRKFAARMRVAHLKY